MICILDQENDDGMMDDNLSVVSGCLFMLGPFQHHFNEIKIKRQNNNKAKLQNLHYSVVITFNFYISNVP